MTTGDLGSLLRECQEELYRKGRAWEKTLLARRIDEALAARPAAPQTPEEYPRLKGRCPACRNDTLLRGSKGYITCSWLKCPNPGAAHDLLATSDPNGAAAPRTEPLDLEPIKARERAATKGPWTNGVRGAGASGDAHMCRIVARGVIDNPNIAGAAIGATWHPEYCISYVGFSRQQNIDNAEFMAHAREDIPQLVAEIERLRAAPAPTIQPDSRTEPLDEKAERDNQKRYSQVDLDMATKPLHAEIERLRAAPAPATGDLAARLRRAADDPLELSYMTGTVRALLREAADTLEGK